MKFLEENGRVNGRGSIGSTHSAVHIENPESHLRWYFRHFLGKAHHNYCGKTTDKLIYVLSVAKSDDQCRVILWAKTGIQRISLPLSSKLTLHSICQEFSDIVIDRSPKEIKDPKLQESLCYIEEQEGAINFKFGVLYKKIGQRTDNEILSNNEMTPGFRKFLGLLGEEICLKGFNGYRGGLDVKTDTTGTHSYTTILEGKSIMFHVALLLPFSQDNPQQVERKRHIGNDIVNIVFQEDDDIFDPHWIKSQMSHTYALVTYQNDDSYNLRVFNEETVPPYGPEINNAYTDPEHFRRVLLVKLINAQKAVYQTPQFVERHKRTLDQLLQEIHQRFVKNTDTNEAPNLRPFTELTDIIKEQTPRIGRKKKNRKEAIFQECGQDLKFKKIVEGLAPHSRTCTSPHTQRKYAQCTTWQHDRIISDFPNKIVCADFWDTYVLLGTDHGMSLIDSETQSISEIYDFLAKQIIVVEDKSIAIVRAEKVKHRTGYMYIFDLAALTMKSQSAKNLKRKIKQERIEKSKGCTLIDHFVMDNKLFLAVAKHKCIQLYEWIKIPGQGQGWFTCKDDFNVSEAQCMQILARPSGLKICVGTADEFLIIDAESGDSDEQCVEVLQKHKANTSLCITPIVKSEFNRWASGVLLTYNNISVLEHFTLHPNNVFTALIKWHGKPLHIRYSLPYFIGIGQQGIEIRLASNGNVVHSFDLHDVTYLSYHNQLIYFSVFNVNSNVCDVSRLPVAINLGSSSTLASVVSNDSEERTPVARRASIYKTSPNIRRSFNGEYLKCDGYMTNKLSFSTQNLTYTTEFDDIMAVGAAGGGGGRGGEAYRSGYDLHCDVFDSPNASLYRVISIEFNPRYGETTAFRVNRVDTD